MEGIRRGHRMMQTADIVQDHTTVLTTEYLDNGKPYRKGL